MLERPHHRLKSKLKVQDPRFGSGRQGFNLMSFVLITAEDTSLEKNDPRRWLMADKETLQRRLSLIEAKNDVKSLANKFRKEHGLSVNPREAVAKLAQRARMERSDEESRLIVKEFLAQNKRNKMAKQNTVSHDSFMANCDDSKHDNCITPFIENCAFEQLRKSQKKFFGRPRSRTQVSHPTNSHRSPRGGVIETGYEDFAGEMSSPVPVTCPARSLL